MIEMKTSELPLFDRSQGARLAEEGTSRAWDNSHEAWKRAAWLEMVRLCSIGCEFNADDIRSKVGDPPGSQNAWGALFRRALRSGFVERCGYRPGQKATAHTRRCAIYRGAEW